MDTFVKAWVDDVAIQLLEGNRLLVRLPPRIGKTHLAESLRDTLGNTALLIDGTALTEPGQAEFRVELEHQIRSTVDAQGSVQVIFDSFDRALRLSQGARLQAWLMSLVVDSDVARDVGALFTARCSTEVHRSGAGSPLMSRVRPIGPPERATVDRDDLSAWFGDSACLAERSSIDGTTALADRLELDESYLADVRGAALVELEAGVVDSTRSSHAARSALQGLLTDSGPTRLFERLRSKLLATPDAVPAWPTDAATSVVKFAGLVGAAPSVIWSDRYMYRDVEALRRFLQQVVNRTDCIIQLLGSEEVNARQVSRAELLRLTTVQGVEARFMLPSDYPNLHERHLYLGPGGWALPQVHVIVGKQRVGNAVVAPVSSFPTPYPTVWRRSATP